MQSREICAHALRTACAAAAASAVLALAACGGGGSADTAGGASANAAGTAGNAAVADGSSATAAAPTNAVADGSGGAAAPTNAVTNGGGGAAAAPQTVTDPMLVAAPAAPATSAATPVASPAAPATSSSVSTASTTPATTPSATTTATSAPPAPTPPVASATVSGPVAPIPLGTWPTTLLQAGRGNDAYWVEDGVWAPWGLTRGNYAGVSGTSYEQYTGVSPDLGPNGEVAFRIQWKWPQCCNEIKAFPSIVSGRKPGWYNSWTKPGGFDVLLPDGTYSQTFPSGATPGTFFPLQLPIASLKTSFNYTHLGTPDGSGQLAYDIFLQNTPDQVNGFGTNVTHEIMIPLDYWGGYGKTRNPQWYDHDVTIDGILFHVYAYKDGNGAVIPAFMSGWKFIVFEPDQPIQPGTLDLAKFINYVSTRRDATGQPWANGNEWAASVELGTEVQQGTGDIQVSNYRVWR